MALILTTGCFGIISFADGQDDEIRFAVCTDIHALEKGAVPAVNYPENELYFHARNSGNLYTEAIGIFVTFLTKMKEEKPDFIILPGDLANDGNQEEHEYFASILNLFEEESGIPVYVAPGNHDYYRSTREEFKSYYHNFGYDEAVNVDTQTASYCVDLPGNFRLIAIDSCLEGKDGDGFDDRLFGWIEARANEAKESGRTVISFMHHPLLDPIPYAELLMKDFIVRDSKKVAEKFTQYGIQYVFTGHEHGNNISAYTGKNGRTVYDILTTALSSYPLEYRMVNLSKDAMDIKNETILECNFDYITEGFTPKQLELMRTDYTEYSKGYFKYSIERKIAKYLTPEFIAGALNQKSGPLYDTIQTVMTLVGEAVEMPLYNKDYDGTTVESIAAKSGVKLPESDYYNLMDLISSGVASIYYGNENMGIETSPEGKLLITALNTQLKYVLAEAGNRQTTQVINSVISAFGLEEIDELNVSLLNRLPLPGADNFYEIAYTIFEPLINKFLVDDDISDRDAVLPGPGETVDPPKKINTFFDKVLSFIKYVFKVAFTSLTVWFR